MRIVLLAIQIVFAAAPLAAAPAVADDLGRYMSAQSIAVLRAGKYIDQSIPSDGTLAFLPRVSATAAISADMKSFRPTVGVEFVRLIKGQAGAAYTSADWLRLFNTLHAASTMQGVHYFSVTRGKDEILFAQSYAVDSPSSPRRVPDPKYASVPAESLFYTFQEDKSFGRNVYGESFSFPGDHLSVKIENLTTISLVLIPIIRPRGFVVRIVLVPAGRDLLFYGVAVLRTTFPIGDRHSREESLSNRLMAMTSWLQAELAAGPPP